MGKGSLNGPLYGEPRLGAVTRRRCAEARGGARRHPIRRVRSQILADSVGVARHLWCRRAHRAFSIARQKSGPLWPHRAEVVPKKEKEFCALGHSPRCACEGGQRPRYPAQRTHSRHPREALSAEVSTPNCQRAVRTARHSGGRSRSVRGGGGALGGCGRQGSSESHQVSSSPQPSPSGGGSWS